MISAFEAMCTFILASVMGVCFGAAVGYINHQAGLIAGLGVFILTALAILNQIFKYRDTGG